MAALAHRASIGAPTTASCADLSAADFDRVRRLIFDRAGISLHAGKQAMVYSRLTRRLREVGLDSFDVYLDRLEAARGPEAELEWQEFVNCLTTNLTAFFREGHHFEELAVALAARRGQRTRIWCNAASTGEEPYSIAMTVVETLGADAGVEILCTDIDTRVLTTARAGVYDADSKGLDTARVKRHFLRGTGSNAGLIRVRPEVAALVRFAPFNLMSPRWSFAQPFDAVFCRNVLIYFDAPTQQAVVARMHGALASGGLLFIGHSETLADSKALFGLRGKTVYRRLGGPGA